MVVHPGLVCSFGSNDMNVGGHENVIEGAGTDRIEGLMHDSVKRAEFSCICRLKADLLKASQLLLVKESCADLLAVVNVVFGIEVAHNDAVFLLFGKLKHLTDLFGSYDLIGPVEMETDKGYLSALYLDLTREIPRVAELEVTLVFDRMNVLQFKP